MITREVTFLIGKDGRVSPSVPQFGGVRGEHNVTTLKITTTDSPFDEGDLVRLSFTLGDGTVVSSDLLDDAHLDETGGVFTASYSLPQLLTRSGGQLGVRAVASTVDENGNEVQTFRSGEMTLWFEDAATENGTPFWMGVSEMLKRTASAKAEALEHARVAKVYQDQAAGAATIADQRAEAAKGHAQNAATLAADADRYSVEAAESASAASDAANEAATALTRAKGYTDMARSYADRASAAAQDAAKAYVDEAILGGAW